MKAPSCPAPERCETACDTGAWSCEEGIYWNDSVQLALGLDAINDRKQGLDVVRVREAVWLHLVGLKPLGSNRARHVTNESRPIGWVVGLKNNREAATDQCCP